MEVLYIGSELGPLTCNPRRVLMKDLTLCFGDTQKKFRLWCVHRHTVRLLAGMYPSQRVVCTPSTYLGGLFPHAVQIKSRADLYLQLLRFDSPPLAWSPPLRI